MAGIETANIVFFSGTGGTARVARHLCDAFAAQGVAATPMELNGKQAPIARADLLVLAYPVYAANAPQPVGEWIATAPEGRGTPAVVVAVSGGGEISPNTASRVAPIRALERKGYPVVYEAMAVMPSNFLEQYDDALNVLLLRKAPALAQRVVREVLSGQTRRLRPLVRDKALARLCLLEHLGSRVFGRHLKVSDACTACGRCAAQCPRGNIAMQNGKPVFGSRCVLCMRCMYGCPVQAITPGFGKFAMFAQGFDLDALEARTKDRTDFPPVEELTKGWGFNGVKQYLAEE